MNITNSQGKHYGLNAVRSTLRHFLLGKVFTSISSVAVLLLLARELSIPDYAIYILIQAVILIVGLVSSFGINQSVMRYVPSLRAEGNNRAMYSLIFISLPIRALAIACVLSAVWWLQPHMVSWLNMGEWSWLLPWCLFMGWLRLLSFFLSQILESLLWQKSSQYSLALTSLIKLLMLIVMISYTDISFKDALMIDLIGEGLAVILLLSALTYGWRDDGERHNGNNKWFVEHRKRVFRYGMWSYFQTISNGLYGSAPNRLFAARFMSTIDLGLFGFVSALTDLGRRYLPTRMLHGMIRPLFFSKLINNSSFRELVQMADFNFRVSLLLLVIPALVLVTAGYPILNWLTNDKYGVAAYLLAAFLCVLALESFWSQIELLAQAVERNHLLVIGNILLSLSLLMALPMVSFLGLWSLVIANIIGNIAAITWIVLSLTREGFPLVIEWKLTLRILILFGVSSVTGLLFNQQFQTLMTGNIISLSLMVLGLIIWPPFLRAEIEVFKNILLKRP